MKLLPLLTLLLLGSALHAQETSFSGTITYELSGEGFSREKNEKMQLIAQFAPNKIRLRARQNNELENEIILIDLDSGKLYTISENAKTYRSRRLASSESRVVAGPRTILGHPTEAVSIQGGSAGSMFKLLPLAGSLQVARDLYFRVPEKYAGAPEMMLFINNRILLAAEFNLDAFLGAYEDEEEDALLMRDKSKGSIKLEAVQITPSACDEELFRIPAGYTRRKRYDYSDLVLDSAAAVSVDTTWATTTMTDTAMIAPVAEMATAMWDTTAAGDVYPYGYYTESTRQTSEGKQIERVIAPRIQTEEGRVEYEKVWLTNNRGGEAQYGQDYLIVGRWVPHPKKRGTTVDRKVEKKVEKRPVSRPKKS